MHFENCSESGTTAQPDVCASGSPRVRDTIDRDLIAKRKNNDGRKLPNEDQRGSISTLSQLKSSKTYAA
jgi:hypothetical protein